MPVRKRLPNIFITGTPGTGKTTHALRVVQRDARFEHLDVSKIVKESNSHLGWDDDWQTYDVDIDKLLDHLHPRLHNGGCILDWHSCDEFFKDEFDLVVVLRTDHSALWKRLAERKYPLKKIQENNEAEIMQVCLEDARETFERERIVELISETEKQIAENVDRICTWISSWEDSL